VPEKIKILKIKINCDRLESIVNKSVELVKEGEKHYICVPNAYLTVVANEREEILNIINNALFVIPDGTPLVWYSKTYKKSLYQRITGYEFFIRYCKKMSENKMSCFFFGGKDRETIKKIIERLKKEFKGIKVRGYYVPPFIDKIEGKIKKEILKVINKNKPDVVWVGLSAPKQEKWIYDNINQLDIGMACGIGAVFDFYSDNIKRAPLLMQKAGLEWLFRILVDPKRLFKKYLIYNSKFLFLIIIDICKRIFKLK